MAFCQPLGVDRLNRAIMRQGTEVEIIKADEQPDGAVAVELVGQRCFQLLGDPWLQEAGEDGEPAPAPLSSVAAATQDSSKFIAARVEFARDSEDGVGSSMAGSGEEIGMESEKMLDKLTGETDYESNLQMSAGSRDLEAASAFSHDMIPKGRWRG
jgi:Lon protease-like protein